jgi:hypothetical protein
MYLVSSFLVFVEQLSFVMTAPTFDSFITLLTGWVFARRRTVTGMIQAADAVNIKHHSAFHRVFSAARWSLDELGFTVFDLIRPYINDHEPIMLALDDTLARKRGLKIFGVGMHHDPLLSSRKTRLVNWGHNWVVLGVVLRFPFVKDKYFCLPILFRLYISRKTNEQRNRRHHTRPELAVEMLEILCKRYAECRFHVVADSAYGGQSVFKHVPRNCDLTARLDMDARLHDAPPVHKPGTMGRPRKRGRRLPSPRRMLKQRAKRLALHIYGRRDRARVIDRVAYSYYVPDCPLRVVAVEPLSGGRKPQAFYSTCYEATAEQVLTWYANRWSVEETFQATKTHLGFEEPQGWTRRAVERTAPTAMLLYSLIVLWFFDQGHREYRLPNRPWYTTKTTPSFADMLTTLRRVSVKEQVLSLRLSGQGSRKVLETALHVVENAA